MKTLTILLILIINFNSYCQVIEEKIFAGSNLKIQLSNSFMTSENEPSFVDLDGITKIVGFQSKMELTFENALKGQEQSIIRAGYFITKKEKLVHHGLKGATIEYDIHDKNLKGLIFIFGKENFQNIISSVYPEERKFEIKKAVLSVVIDETVTVSNDTILGFHILDKSGPFNKADVTSIVITYEHRNKKGELIGNLKISKFPKDIFEGLKIKETIGALTSKFFSNPTIISDKEFELKEDKFIGSERILKTIKNNGFPQFNYLAFINLDNFDIVVVGSTNTSDNIKYMEQITKSIKLD
ncbi:MAG: hypothetical protein RLO12_23255 [Fulvivirga sp.]